MQALRGRAGAFACALGLVVWSCSSSPRDFGDGDQPGGAGEGGEAPSDGAGGSDATVNGGASAGTTGGTVAEAGGGSQLQELSVVSTSPADAATGAERDVAVEVTFSAAIDPDSVTADSFQVTGPAGPVGGKLSVKGATVTFTPNNVWALLTDYVVDVAATVTTVDADELGAAYEFGFQTRDGVLRKPERLFSSPAYLGAAVGNPAGDILVGWSDRQTPQSTFAALFDPKTGVWGAAAPLEADTKNDFSGLSLALNDAGDVIAISSGLTLVSLNRAKGGKWSGAKPAGIAQTRAVRLADDGAAMTVWDAMVQNQYDVFAAPLSADDKWGPTVTLSTKAGVRGLARYGSGYLAVLSHDPGGEVAYRVCNDKGIWSAEEPITATAKFAGYTQLATRGKAALFTWKDGESRMQVSEFDGKAWVTKELGPATTGTTASVAAKAHVATWLNQTSAYAARYDVETGWGDPVKLGPTTVEDVGPAAGLDDAGNAIVAWPNGSDIVWRRFSQASMAWSDPQLIKDQDPGYIYSSSDASGNVMFIWNNPLGVWASRFE